MFSPLRMEQEISKGVDCMKKDLVDWRDDPLLSAWYEWIECNHTQATNP